MVEWDRLRQFARRGLIEYDCGFGALQPLEYNKDSMRFLGEIDGQQSAEKFVAHLLTEDIDTHIELAHSDSDNWEVWVRDEDQLHRAKTELDEFQANRSDPKYAAAVANAQKILSEKARLRREAAKNLKRVNPSQRPSLGGGKMPPLTLTLFILCIAVGLFTSFGKPGRNNELGKTIKRQLSFVDLEHYQQSEGDPAASLKRGQVWRAITPIFLHFGLIHLALNMFMFASFGKLVERWVGTPKFAAMVLVMAILPNLLQGLAPEWMHGSFSFGGISGVLYGLFGYVWIRTSINPMHGIAIPFPMIAILVGLIVIGLSGLVPNWPFADLCHLGGLLVGVAFGFASERGHKD